MRVSRKINIVKVGNFILNNGFYVVFTILFLVLAIKIPIFFTSANLGAILYQASPIMVVATGLTLVIIAGGIDISVGGTVFFTATIGAFIMSDLGLNPGLGIATSIIAGAIVGIINGLLIIKVKISPLITTLGMMFATRGAALIILKRGEIWLPNFMAKLGVLKFGPVYFESIIAIIIIIIGQIALVKTSFGRYVFAVGNNEEVAKRCGVKVDRIKIYTYVISGICASIGGILSIAQITAVTYNLGQGLEFAAIAIVVIGGTSLLGGKGSLFPGTTFGALFIAVIVNGMNLINLSPFLYPFVQASIIFIAIFIDSLRYRNIRIGNILKI